MSPRPATGPPCSLVMVPGPGGTPMSGEVMAVAHEAPLSFDLRVAGGRGFFACPDLRTRRDRNCKWVSIPVKDCKSSSIAIHFRPAASGPVRPRPGGSAHGGK
jgi:hypothetical protein